jgi:geranylgeranyl diphosphate synthase, type I
MPPVGLFEQVLSQTQAAVDVGLATFFHHQEKLPQARNSAIFGAVRELSRRGGKRLRPALLGLAYDGIARDPKAPILPAQIALELLQTYLLIHDDWMDGDETRRGGPSVHIALRRELGGRHEGDSAAILAGDLAAALALTALRQTPVAAERLLASLDVFVETQISVVLGQEQDLFPPLDMSLGFLETMYAGKTGSYTVAGPLLMGAALAGASLDQMCALRAFAHPLGVAFQLRDDLLGAFGDEARTGKPEGSDILRGKYTSVMVALRSRDAALAERILSRSVQSAQLPAVRFAIEEQGARKEVEERLSELLAESRRLLPAVGLRGPVPEQVLGAISALGVRDR